MAVVLPRPEHGVLGTGALSAHKSGIAGSVIVAQLRDISTLANPKSCCDNALVVLPLVLIKENRRLQAWAILIPLFVVIVICHMLATLIFPQSATAEEFCIFSVTLVTAWAMVWLVGFWFASRHQRVAITSALSIMAAVGLLSYVCNGGNLRLEGLALLTIYYTIDASGLMLPMALGGRCCRKVYSPRRFMSWLFLWTLVTAAAGMFLFFGGFAIYAGPAAGPLTMAVVAMAALLGGIFGVALYLLNLPFMLLAFRNSLYRERFCKVFRLQPAPVAEEAAVSEPV